MCSPSEEVLCVRKETIGTPQQPYICLQFHDSLSKYPAWNHVTQKGIRGLARRPACSGHEKLKGLPCYIQKDTKKLNNIKRQLHYIRMYLNIPNWAGKIAQWVNLVVTKPGNLNSLLRTYTIGQNLHIPSVRHTPNTYRLTKQTNVSQT